MNDTIVKQGVSVGFCSDSSERELSPFIGKTVYRIESNEYSFVVYFSDGSSICLKGHTFSDCALSVEID